MNIKDNEIHIWIISINNYKNNYDYYSLLSKQDRLIANGFLNEKVKKKYIYFHFALKNILSFYLKCSMKKIKFFHNKFQKPFLLRNSSAIEFNFAHSHNVAILALSKDNSLGVDIEKIKNLEQQQAIEDLFLTPNESRWLSRLPNSYRLEGFYRLWTAKEAFIKAIGKGFYFDPKNIDFYMPKNIINNIIYSSKEYNGWTLKNFIPLDGYMAALCSEKAAKVISQFKWQEPIITAGQ
jgi:4'-phosphopantetheinyl transferase